jgi:hypothetical protein
VIGEQRLFTKAEVTELERIAAAEQLREKVRLQTKRERRVQGLPEFVEVTLWDQ